MTVRDFPAPIFFPHSARDMLGIDLLNEPNQFLPKVSNRVDSLFVFENIPLLSSKRYVPVS